MTSRSAPSLPDWRRLPVGAELAPGGGVHFRVWAPACRAVDVVVERGGAADTPLARERHGRGDDGWFSGCVPDATAGTRYRLRLDGGDALPDPASRWQPEGPHGPSVVVDPRAFAWTDGEWPGVGLHGHAVYELHVGTFTPEGTWRAAIAELPQLAELGVTLLEVMPVAEFPGRFGWGYDGVDLFAPTRLYGTPDDFRAFVDAAHAHGLGVILDVVYNHVGPDGNYLARFSPYYFSEGDATEWGAALNFDGAHSRPVRDFVVANARHWIEEYHLDGLRFDATHAMVDRSPRHILAEVGDAARAAARRPDGTPRGTWLVGEDESQRIERVVAPEAGGHGLDAVWNDDWHHAAMVALTGRDEAYLSDYRGTPQEFVSAAKHAFLYQGQWYRWQRKRRGSPTYGVHPARFVHFLQNHDQIANSGRGDRIHRHTSPGRLRALTALLLLGPQTPMLFQGQEYAASQPFLYFADHHPELATLVASGRRKELAQFANLALDEMARELALPHDEATFRRCKLDPKERHRNAEWLALHRDLLRLRKRDPCFREPRLHGVDGAVLGPGALVLRFFAAEPDAEDHGEPRGAPVAPHVAGGDRLLLVNLGAVLHLDPAPEPLLAPPRGLRWTIAWSSEHPCYGGLGTPDVDAAESPRTPPQRPDLRWPRENWRIPGECAVVLVGAPREVSRDAPSSPPSSRSVP